MSSPPARTEPSVEVTVTTAPLQIESAYAAVARPDCGGVAVFAGVVRDHHEGEAVDHLEYEAWHEQAETAMREVVARVAGRCPDVRAMHVSHRVGRLEVGEISVLCAAAAPHRREALRAAQLLIDDVKASVPIWKRELLRDGGSRWPTNAEAAT